MYHLRAAYMVISAYTNDTLEDIMESPNPRERFTEIINNWALDYDIGEVYGLCKSAWEETLREVKEVI